MGALGARIDALAPAAGSEEVLRELDSWCQDPELVSRLTEYTQARRDAAAEHLRSTFQPVPSTRDAVSEAALRRVLATGRHVHAISHDPGLSNVIVFNASHIPDAVHDPEIRRLRRRVDETVAEKVRELAGGDASWRVRSSGDFWYPPGSCMGWHTNSGAPGLRIYLSCADAAGRSFFRYRHPDTGEIITSWDGLRNVRAFRIEPRRDLWHAVYSETNRFSLGYMVQRHGPLARLRRNLRRLRR